MQPYIVRELMASARLAFTCPASFSPLPLWFSREPMDSSHGTLADFSRRTWAPQAASRPSPTATRTLSCQPGSFTGFRHLGVFHVLGGYSSIYKHDFFLLGRGSKLNRGGTWVLVHVSTYQASNFGTGFLSHSHIYIYSYTLHQAHFDFGLFE